MIYTRPFATMRFIAYEGDTFTTELPLVVQVLDAFNRQAPEVQLNVRLKQLPRIKPIRSQSGFYCFEKRRVEIINGQPTSNEIPDGNYTLLVEPDPTSGNWYNLQPKQAADPWTTTFERPIVLPMPDPLNPLETVALSPTPAYPFPGNATLVRGKVFRAGVEVPTAEVTADYDEVDPLDTTQTVPVHVETITDRSGEYVLFFKKLPAKQQFVVLQAAENGPPSQITVQITEGTTLTKQNLTLV
jgi:hypothetical protein